MRIITLMDNLVYRTKYIGEHGYCVYIETDRKKILFDTGQSGNFIHNAGILGINISDIDDLVLSHGHHDHTGGLLAFLNENKKAKIHMKKEALDNKYKNRDEYVGVPFSREILGNRVNFTDKTTQLDDEIFIMPDIPVLDNEDTHYENMFIRDGEYFLEDTFTDEQFLVLKTKNKISVVSGCSHRGITNILEAARKEFPLPVELVSGGLHLGGANPDQIQKIAFFLKDINPERIGICHCTGLDAYFNFRKIFPDRVIYQHTGYEVKLGESKLTS